MLDLAKRPNIIIWISGCSTGQEAYSMAILLNEVGLLSRSRIFATDINDKVLAVAKKGQYRYRNNLDYISNFNKVISYNPLNYDESNKVKPAKYFTIDKVKDQIIMHSFLRNKIMFMNNDLVKNPVMNFAKFDLISCRKQTKTSSTAAR
jgi:chemotaxis protein methyltransferase CheR